MSPTPHLTFIPKTYPTPLDQPNPFCQIEPLWEAYNQCISLERHPEFAQELQKDISESTTNDLTPRVAARVLGWGLVLALSDNGRVGLAHEIVSCEGDPELLVGLAHLYVHGLIRVFYNPKGPTPSITPTQSPRHSVQEAVQNVEHILSKPSITAQDLRQLTLFRDDNRCVFTGCVDMQLATSEILKGIKPLGPNEKMGSTRVAHIISQSLSENIDGVTLAVQSKFQWAKTAGAMIERFGGFKTHDILGEDVLNSPLNVFTANPEPHGLFDQLDIWMTPAMTAQEDIIPNTYDVHHYFNDELLSIICFGIKRQVKFRTAVVGNKIIPPPHPRIIGLHAACAQIAHMSGAVGYLKEFYRDIDMISVMTEPNAVYELTRALKALQTV